MIMKTNFWKSAAVLALGLAALVACDPVEDTAKIDPVFPAEVLEQNVEAGATVQISFDANQDWELSLPASEQNKFWLDDAGMPASKVSGKAGAQTVSVIFSEDEYYDENVLCEVTLSMGGQSKVIAKLTRLAINRSLEVYVAKTNSWGGFKNEYEATKATSLELLTFEGDPTYTLKIKVLANYDWSLSLPSWCAGEIKVAAGETAPESLSGKAGLTVEILLSGQLSSDVKEGAQDFARFIDATDNTKSENMELTLPAFGDRVESTAPNSWDFDADGSTQAISYILAMNGYVVKALEFDGEYHDFEFADWVKAELMTDGEQSTDLLQLHALKLVADKNEGKERVADLFVFPASLADVTPDLICNNNDCMQFNAPYAQYYVGRISQAGVAGPFITPSSTDEMMASAGTYFEELGAKDSNNPMQWDFAGAKAFYKFTYTESWSDEEGTFTINQPFASYKLFEDTDYPMGFFSSEVTESDSHWTKLWFNADKTSAKFQMPSVPSSPCQTAAVFYDEEGGILAAILLEYNPDYNGGNSGGNTPTITVESGSATIADLTSIGLTEGFLNSIVSKLGMGTAASEFVIMAETAEAGYSTSFEFQSIFILDTDGNVLEPATFSCYADSSKTFKITATSDADYILLFMDANGGFPAVAYYTYYAQ